MNNLPQKDFETPNRITWSSTSSEVLDVLDFEKGVLLTIKELVLRPKATINDYLYGNRSKYANPLRFLLFSTAIVTLLNFYLVYQPNFTEGLFTETEESNVFTTEFGSDNAVLTTDFQPEPSNIIDGVQSQDVDVNSSVSKEMVQEIVQDAINELFNWMDKFTFALVPLFSFFTYWFFRKTKYNYTENLVINAFMVSITNVIALVFVFPSFYAPSTWSIVLAFISTSFTLYFLFKVFAEQSFKGFIKVLTAFAITYTLYFFMILGFLVFMIVNSTDKLEAVL